MKYIPLSLSLLVLCSCQSHEERLQQEAQAATAACLKAGYAEGTPAFDDCKIEMKIQQDQRRQDRINALQDVHPIQSNYQQVSPPPGNSIPLP